jgi:hypothetical protein
MLHHMATILVCYGGHFESKMAAKIQKSSDLAVKFHQFLFGEQPAMILFVFFNFLAFWPFPWHDVCYCFAMAILVIIIILPHIFVRSISRRCLDQTL